MTVLHRLRPHQASVAAAVFLLVSCANQIPPAGGPMDEQGPEVVWTDPLPYALNVSTDRIEIEFSEHVDRRTAEEAIFISPSIPGVEYDWSGTTVTLSFRERLQDSTTYVVTVGTDVRDIEPSRRNPMASAFTLAFSTGGSIDRGLLAGRIVPRRPEDELTGVLVHAYALPTSRTDTLNVQHAAPSYVTQAGKDGTFALPHVRFGTYLVMALRDASRNGVYDREEDEFGVPPSVARLSSLDTAATRFVLQLAAEDTTGPRLTKLEAKDRNHLRAEFSEPIDTSAGRSIVATVADTLTRAAVSVYAVTFDLPDLNKATVATDFLAAGSAYLVSFSGISDRAGNPGHPEALRRVVTAGTAIDSSRPGVAALSVRDSARNVRPDLGVLVTFTEPVQTDGWQAGRVRLRDLSGGRELAVATRWPTRSALLVTPERPLRGATWFELTLELHGLIDWKLQAVRDSVRRVRFETRNDDESGAIAGRVVDRSPTDTAGAIIVVATEGRSKGARVEVRADRSGAFELAPLDPGPYVLHAYRDRNASGTYDPGHPRPFAPSERRTPSSDTLKVRARWPLEGVVLTLP